MYLEHNVLSFPEIPSLVLRPYVKVPLPDKLQFWSICSSLIPGGAGVSVNPGRGVAHHLFLQTHLQFQIQSWNPCWDQMDINLYNEKKKYIIYLELWSDSIFKPNQTKPNLRAR